MSDTLYRKVGRRYVPVHDCEAYDGLSNGSWLVVVADGSRTCVRLVEPARAEWVAAVEIASDAMVEALRRASAARPRDARLSRKSQQAYEAWKAVMGEESMWLTRDTAWGVVQAGLDAVRETAVGTSGGQGE